MIARKSDNNNLEYHTINKMKLPLLQHINFKKDWTKRPARITFWECTKKSA